MYSRKGAALQYPSTPPPPPPPNARNSARMNERKSPIKKTKRDKTNNVQLKRDNPFSEDNIQITREHRDKFEPFARQAMKKSVIKKLI
jgi:hypothetical protein